MKIREACAKLSAAAHTFLKKYVPGLNRGVCITVSSRPLSPFSGGEAYKMLNVSKKAGIAIFTFLGSESE